MSRYDRETLERMYELGMWEYDDIYYRAVHYLTLLVSDEYDLWYRQALAAVEEVKYTIVNEYITYWYDEYVYEYCQDGNADDDQWCHDLANGALEYLKDDESEVWEQVIARARTVDA